MLPLLGTGFILLSNGGAPVENKSDNLNCSNKYSYQIEGRQNEQKREREKKDNLLLAKYVFSFDCYTHHSAGSCKEFMQSAVGTGGSWYWWQLVLVELCGYKNHNKRKEVLLYVVRLQKKKTTQLFPPNSSATGIVHISCAECPSVVRE